MAVNSPVYLISCYTSGVIQVKNLSNVDIAIDDLPPMATELSMRAAIFTKKGTDATNLIVI